MAVQPLAIVTGLVRNAEPQTRRNDNGSTETYAVQLNVLTEPNGGFLEVTVWPRDLPIERAVELAGQNVEILVALGVFVSQRGGGFLRATYAGAVSPSAGRRDAAAA